MVVIRKECLLVPVLVLGLTATAQNRPISGEADVAAFGVDDAHRARIVRTEQPPVIDGKLDDEVWKTATVIDNLRQVEPVENSEPSEKTIVRILYDRDFLYVAFMCYDREPDKIIATQMRREGQLFRDDRVAIVVDTFLDRRNAYFFEMNPVGGRTDALVENNNNLRFDWDGIWYGRASITEEGWIAEMAIPFKTLNFDPDIDTWGFNISRGIRRKNEDLRWSSPFQNRSIRTISHAGLLEGITDIEQGIGLDFKPYGIVSYLRNHNDDRESLDFDGGFDLFYNLSPSLKGAITVNTDFAETEVDERQVNLTRFPLFFPEKRDFFLQDAGIFSFGGIRRNPLPFQSRRIGIGPDGEPVDIIAGAKVSGRVGDLNIGLLDVQTDSSAGVEGKNLAVGRISMNVLSESELGVIFTNGDPGSNASNSLLGVDFNFRDSKFNGDKVVTGGVWFQKSFTPGVKSGDTALGVKLGYPNDRLEWNLAFTQVEENFNPALGFVPRNGIREYFIRGRYRWRPGGDIRRIDVGVFSQLFTNLDDETESASARFTLFNLETEFGDQYELQYRIVREVIDSPFEISDGIIIPVGAYDWDRWSVKYEGSRARLFRFEAELNYGDFWTGDRWDIRGEIEWRVSSQLSLGVEFEQNSVELNEGKFITRLARGRINIFFTPDISWQSFIQFDNVSDTLGINSRFRWILEPGNELFFVINQSYDVIDSRPHSGFTEVTSKIGWTFRF
ncbi:MAG: carbohydrate binding family 9 domain-containing protein [Planctomycetes bacterium]|nr:carbohydrate binding family 9 domain-containing protein [Planctomycetota bacterium]